VKKIAAVFLLSVVLLCSSGFYLAFVVSLQSIKLSQKKIIASTNVENKLILKFSLSREDCSREVSFKDNDEEMSFRGKMYDIISIVKNKDSISITCIPDGREDEILLMMTNSEFKIQKKNTNHKLLELKWRLENFTPPSDSIVSFLFESFSYRFFNKETNNLPVPYFNIPSPPPWEVHTGFRLFEYALS
jgi:hypothetical protein